jgi:hypothetical protein
MEEPPHPAPISPVAFSVGRGVPEASPGAVAWLPALLRGAVARGIRRFDLTESPAPSATSSLLRELLAPAWAEATLFVPAAPIRGDAPTTPRSDRTIPMYLDASPMPPRAGAAPESFGVRFSEIGAAESGAIAWVEGGASWVAFPGHLLEATRVRRLARAVIGAGGSTLLTNPHADGRLDGRWLSAGVLEHDGPPKATEFAALQRSYAPVLTLGFLTERHRRTLAQAAVAFSLAVRTVPSVRFRDVRQVEELADPTRYEPLSDEELARLERSSGSGPAAPEFK